jgi:hypothetical protein
MNRRRMKRRVARGNLSFQSLEKIGATSSNGWKLREVEFAMIGNELLPAETYL